MRGPHSPTEEGLSSSGGLQPVRPGISHGGGARSLPARSFRQQEDKGVRDILEGWGPGLPVRTRGAPRLREGLERSAPSRVGCCPDSACCRKSVPPYLEPCSEEKPVEKQHVSPARAWVIATRQERTRACTGLRNRRGEITSSFSSNGSLREKQWLSAPHPQPPRSPPHLAPAPFSVSAGPGWQPEAILFWL